MTPRARSLALLRERVASLPEALLALPEPTALGGAFRDARRVIATGIGSSAAHARFLAAVVNEAGAVPARFVPLGAFPRAHAEPHADDALVVFSQGLSPNARLALAAPEAWRCVVLISCEAAWDAEKRAFADALRAAGGVVLDGGGGAEYGTLVRVVGPLLGYAAALDVARATRSPAPSRARSPWARRPAGRSGPTSSRARCSSSPTAPTRSCVTTCA